MFMNFGGCRPILVELHDEVLTNQKVQWRRSKVNLMELAKRRWIDKWSIKRLSKQFDRKPDTIKMYLGRLRSGGIKKLHFSTKEFHEINQSLNVIFRGKG